MAATAAAQITGNNYWEAIPPEVAGGPAKPAPPPIIPNVPFAPVRNVPVLAKLKIDKDFKLLGPYAPLWLGTKSVALLGTRRGQVTLLAWDSERLVSPRVVVDPSTIHGGAILDMAMSRDGKRVAIAAAAGDNLQVWLRDTQSDAQASIVATIDGRCDKAGIAWLDANTVAVGAQMEQSAPPPPAQSPIIMPGQPQQPAAAPQPSNNLYIAQLGQQKSPARIDLECLGHVDPTTLTWSPEGSHAVAVSEEQGKWMLIDRAKATCAEIKLPNIVPAKFIDWGDKAQRFLFTATPARFPDPGHVGVMEYSLAAHKARLIASPATAAAYVGGGRIVALGSQRLNAAAMAANPDALFPAQIAWVDPGQSELNIVPTGFASSATELLHAHLVYSAAKGLLATAFQTPNPKGEFSVLMWISAVAHSGGVLGTGKMGTMLLSWSPDGSRLAVLAGLPDHPTLAIVAAPQ
ncbi:MAG TPA: LpqB family beta-propeller domain-containing protein [Candidatus Binataceae bacterium]|nr:LpqB family beta-propeller domain-containing protein [Candidatus Binataceae bacterium]